jgi:amidohydrolase
MSERGVLMVVVQNLEEYIREASRTAKEVFEEIHSWPELGNEEFKTVTLIGKKLKSFGLGIERPLATAVVANIKGCAGASKRKTYAFRADIDALPISEKTMVSYRSRRAGVMHACGHDAHAGVLVGLAQVLCRLRDQLPCDVRLILQPDEEGNGGAEKLIKSGVLKGVDQIFGFHVKPELPAGTVGIQYGTVHGESRMFQAEISGTRAHGAKPHLGRDAIYGAAEFISMCQGILSRDLDPARAGLITFGRIEGGEAGNVLAGHVEMKGIVRGEDEAVCDLLCDRMNIIAKGLSQVLSMDMELKFVPGCVCLVNDPSSVKQVRKAAEAGMGKVTEIKRISMTVDDFSSYLRHVPGAYFFLGSGFEGRENSPLHTGDFQVNKDCLRVGVETLARICFG